MEIATQTAAARQRQAEGEATYIAETERAKGAEMAAVGLARAKGFAAQMHALGQGPTAIIIVATALAEPGVKIVPEILAVGGEVAWKALCNPHEVSDRWGSTSGRPAHR